MKATFSLGRIAGVRVGFNWSILVIAGLLAVSLAGGILPAQAPGYSSAVYLLVGLAGAAGLLGSILAHELGHAIVARRNGIAVDGITLWLFGGVASIKGTMPSARVEAKVAGIGPAVSIGIAVAAGAAAALLFWAGMPALVIAAISWLAVINLVLALFNLLPGSPLDGGRLLHAFIWWRRGDRIRATAGAARAGRFIGFGLVALGVAEVVYFGTLAGLWTSAIGWFLAGAATAEGAQGVAREALAGLSVRDIMSRDPVTAPGWITVDEFLARHLWSGRHSTYPLEAFDGRIMGVVTPADIARVPEADRAARRVAEVAVPIDALVLAGPEEPANDLVARMAGKPVALVFDDGRLTGIVTHSDVVRAVERGKLLKTR